MRNSHKEPASIGQLYAANIFPLHVNDTLRNENLKQRNTGRKIPVAVTRLERVTFAETVTNHAPVMAHLPYINKDAMAMTMDNYRAYVNRYNEEIGLLNTSIKKYNSEVDQQLSINQDSISDVIKNLSRVFVLRNSQKPAKQYNELVEDFNKTYGILVKKKCHLTIKYATEIIFQQMIYLYSFKLTKYSNEYTKLSITHLAPVKQMTINSCSLSTARRNDIQAISICKQTIRNHRKRLEEAGVLVDYMFRGHKTGLKMNVNSEILVVYDAKTGKYSNSENQEVTPQTHKELTNMNEATGTYKNNIKKIEKGIAVFLDKGTASPDSLFVFLPEHPRQERNSTRAGAPKNVKVSNNYSEKLENLILHPQELAVQLSAGTFNNYKPMDSDYLERESMYGTMTREEFKDLTIQMIFCYAARLYRGKNVYPGSWKKAINSYHEKLFLVNNGNGEFLVHKSVMVQKLKEILWCLNRNHKWFLKTGINPLFPSDYFDFSRTESKELGFEYSRKAYKLHQKYLEEKPKVQHTIKKKTEKRKTAINYAKKFDNKLNQYFKNRISLDEMIDYVTNNLPSEFMTKFSEKLTQISTKYTC